MTDPRSENKWATVSSIKHELINTNNTHEKRRTTQQHRNNDQHDLTKNSNVPMSNLLKTVTYNNVPRSKTNEQFKFPVPIRHYWCGFDTNGSEKWYIEFSDGTLMTNESEEYDELVKKYFTTKLF